MIQIQVTHSPWEIAHTDWVKALPSGEDRSFSACPMIIDIYGKTPIFFSCNKDDTAMYTSLLISNRVISHNFLFKTSISDRDPKFTSALQTNLHRLFGPKLSFSTVYNPHAGGLAERMIQELKDMVRKFCAYGLEWK
ncbi:hypothetical protein O181_094060 [Austropuccinia psidii MF-1]|uniref:Integrase catalytic domain-containing protein n=1 Tax=Austropuccinia psidii MF-1 TaxID=1389203 RepID=A0A9Q3PAQ1_9BASI|nr:hypothetical protein [Austropuccinia psidii MF-1]